MQRGAQVYACAFESAHRIVILCVTDRRPCSSLLVVNKKFVAASASCSAFR